MVYDLKMSMFGPLPIRVILGISFFLHGLPKLMNPERTQGFLSNIGMPIELSIAIILLEVIGGITVLIGVATRIIALLFSIFMISIILVVKLPDGFIGGYELELLLAAMSVSLVLTGPGILSIEWNILKREAIPKGTEIDNSAKIKNKR